MTLPAGISPEKLREERRAVVAAATARGHVMPANRWECLNCGTVAYVLDGRIGIMPRIEPGGTFDRAEDRPCPKSAAGVAAARDQQP